mgnify:CR=1 FL=1
MAVTLFQSSSEGKFNGNPVPSVGIFANNLEKLFML